MRVVSAKRTLLRWQLINIIIIRSSLVLPIIPGSAFTVHVCFRKDGRFWDGIWSMKTIKGGDIVSIFHTVICSQTKKEYYPVEMCCFIKVTVQCPHPRIP